jgi:hypothetical protein
MPQGFASLHGCMYRLWRTQPDQLMNEEVFIIII